MKIQAEQLNALLRQERAAEKDRPGREGFEAVFARELGQAEGAQGVLPPPPGAQAGILAGLLLETSEQTNAADPAEDAFLHSVRQASGVLDSWENYAKTLSAGSAEGNLKEVYPLLEGLERQVRDLKRGAAPLAGKHAGLEDLINELEVMTVAEKFKFNRGDYLQ